MANTNRQRVQLNQWLDYRIFVVSTYHKNELSIDAVKSAFSQDFISGIEEENESSEYFFLRYPIDDYVEKFSITRNFDTSPSTATIEIFPELQDIKKPENDFKFFYKLKNRFVPVFRPWDYIEIQVAELSVPDSSLSARQEEIRQFGNLLLNKKRSTDYTNKDISKFYKVRFRGFITDISEDDGADSGRTITLEAKSILYYLSQTPFISNLAIFTDRFTETQRAHLLENQFIVLYGDLLNDLRDTTSRANLLMEDAFQTKSKIETISITSKTVSGKTKTFTDSNFLGLVDNPKEAFKKLITRLNINEIKKASGAQALLIPLTELYLSQINNTAGTNTYYKIFKSELFNQEIQFDGTNTEFISQFVYLLQTLKTWAESIKYVLFEQANGTITFDRPNLNGTIDIVVEPFKWTNYSFKETEGGFWTEFYVTPGTALQVFDDSIRETFFQTSGYTLDQLRRYGYRRPQPETNPNVSTSKALQQYAKVSKAINNALLKSMSFSIPYDKRIDIGSIVWFQEKNIVGYVTDFSESITYGGEGTMSVTLRFLREITDITKFKTNITKDLFATSKELVKKVVPQKIANKISVSSTEVTLDPIEVINDTIEGIRNFGSKKKISEADIEKAIKNFLAENIIIETFPEFTFISDFYSGKIQPILQSEIVDRQERSVK